MNVLDRLHFCHRAWRYRLRGDKFGIAFLFSRDLAGKVAVDIGAHNGIYSYWMHKRVGPQGRVVAFEPQPEQNDRLRRLKESFRLDRLEIAGMGLSSARRELRLVRPPDKTGTASFEVPENDQYDSLTVAVTTLDDYFREHAARPISFVKCDVEGHEMHVFRGAQEVLEKDRPDLLFECLSPEDPDCEVFAWLGEHGYASFCFLPNGYAPIARYSEVKPLLHKKAYLNFAAVPEERADLLTR